MINVSDTIMYVNYYKKNFYLSYLKKYKKLDYTGRIADKNPELRGYEGCYPIQKILKKLNSTPNDSILDIGCGKGLFLYYASKFKFCQIDGIEYSKELTEIALKNLAKMKDARVHIKQCDAREFQEYDKYNYFFINNPFTAEITEFVVKKICESYHNKKRKITVIYQFPFQKEIFLNYEFEELYEKFPNCILTFG